MIVTTFRYILYHTQRKLLIISECCVPSIHGQAEVDSKKEREELAESLAKRPRLKDSSSDDEDDDDDSRDPGKTE